MALTASEILRRRYGTKPNFMTPNRVRIGKVHPDVAFELSTGRGFDNEIIYGVTFACLSDAEDRELRNRLSSLFTSILKAKAYVEYVKTPRWYLVDSDFRLLTPVEAALLRAQGTDCLESDAP